MALKHVLSTTVSGGKVVAHIPDDGKGRLGAFERVRADDPAWWREAIYHGTVNYDYQKPLFMFVEQQRWDEMQGKV